MAKLKMKIKEITLSEARKIEPDYEVGEDVSETVDFNKFGRRAILTLRQTLASRFLSWSMIHSTTNTRIA